jgi:hypothetical protein
MKKKKELFFFFHINDPATFKAKLASDIHPRITTTPQLLDVALMPVTAVNIAFSNTGLVALGVTDELDDSDFKTGQEDLANGLGDVPSNWEEGYKGKQTHGVFLLASDTIDNVNAELAAIQGFLGDSITERHRLQGQARPGDQDGHERKFR